MVTKEMESKKIKIQPVTREGSWLSQISKNHDGAFMFTGTWGHYTVPQAPDGKLFNVLKGVSDEVISWLEKEIGLEKGELSPFRQKKNNFWQRNKLSRVRLNKDGLTLDLSNPYDYIKYLVLKSNIEIVAPSWNERYNKGTYRFAFVDEDTVIKEGSKKAETLKNCYIQFGRMEDNISKMKGVLRIYFIVTKANQKVPKNAKKEFLHNEVNKFIETNPRLFLEIVEDPTFGYKADIAAAIENGALIKVGKSKYQFKDMLDETFTYDELIAYLSKPENSERYLSLKAEIAE